MGVRTNAKAGARKALDLFRLAGATAPSAEPEAVTQTCACGRPVRYAACGRCEDCYVDQTTTWADEHTTGTYSSPIARSRYEEPLGRQAARAAGFRPGHGSNVYNGGGQLRGRR